MSDRRRARFGYKPWRRQRDGDDLMLGSLIVMVGACAMFLLIVGTYLWRTFGSVSTP